MHVYSICWLTREGRSLCTNFKDRSSNMETSYPTLFKRSDIYWGGSYQTNRKPSNNLSHCWHSPSLWRSTDEGTGVLGTPLLKINCPMQKHSLHKVKLLSRVRLFAIPWTEAYQASRSKNFPDKSTGVGCHFLLQRIFPTQGTNPGLTHCSRQFTVWATREDPLHRDLLYSIGNYTQYFVYKGRESAVYTCVYLNSWAVHLKLTRDCKQTVFFKVLYHLPVCP